MVLETEVNIGRVPSMWMAAIYLGHWRSQQWHHYNNIFATECCPRNLVCFCLFVFTTFTSTISVRSTESLTFGRKFWLESWKRVFFLSVHWLFTWLIKQIIRIHKHINNMHHSLICDEGGHTWVKELNKPRKKCLNKMTWPSSSYGQNQLWATTDKTKCWKLSGHW